MSIETYEGKLLWPRFEFANHLVLCNLVFHTLGETDELE